MLFLDSIFSTLLSREQRERHTRSKWDKSVAAAALNLSAPAILTPPSTPTKLTINTTMTRSLSSASSTTSSTSSPTRLSASPPAPYRRHTSLTRSPISYDSLITPTTTTTTASPPQLLYPLPPLGQMQGIGKYRRSVNTPADYLNTLEKNTIAALQPLAEDLESELRGRTENKNTTTPPRAYSISPPKGQAAMMQADIEKWTRELDEGFEDVVEIRSALEEERPVRVATKRRAQSSRERSRNVRSRTTVKNTGGKKNKKVAAREAALSASMETLLSGEE